MPELPEVETVRLGLERRLVGRHILSVAFLNSRIIRGNARRLSREIAGCAVTRLHRKGKMLALELHGPEQGAENYLLIRLGMTGQLVITKAAAFVPRHTHMRLVLGGGEEELRFRDARRFGMLRWCTPAEAESAFGVLGPDALDISEAGFDLAIRGRKGAIKAWLLNQHRLAGVGNIYADEALFEARINPKCIAGRISKARRKRLYAAMHQVLRRAIGQQGTTFRDYVDVDGNRGKFDSFLNAYGRTGEPCRRCGSLIQRIIISGRSSHFCPHCQPMPRERRCKPSPRNRNHRPTRVTRSREVTHANMT